MFKIVKAMMNWSLNAQNGTDKLTHFCSKTGNSKPVKPNNEAQGRA